MLNFRIMCSLRTPRPICRSTSRPIYRSTVGRHIDRCSTDMSVDISTDSRPVCRSRCIDRHVDRHIGRYFDRYVGRYGGLFLGLYRTTWNRGLNIKWHVNKVNYNKFPQKYQKSLIYVYLIHIHRLKHSILMT